MLFQVRITIFCWVFFMSVITMLTFIYAAVLCRCWRLLLSVVLFVSVYFMLAVEHNQSVYVYEKCSYHNRSHFLGCTVCVYISCIWYVYAYWYICIFSSGFLSAVVISFPRLMFREIVSVSDFFGNFSGFVCQSSFVSWCLHFILFPCAFIWTCEFVLGTGQQLLRLLVCYSWSYIAV